MSFVPVLMYHHVAEDREIKPVDFENHLIFFKKNGYKTASLDEFYLHVLGEKKLPHKTVLLTFDDGYADNWIFAYPILKKYGMKAVIFATTECMGNNKPRPTLEQGAKPYNTLICERGDGGFVSWEELKIMTDSEVFDIASHTHTHNNFDNKKIYKNIEWELLESKKIIYEKLGREIFSIAWPWGYYEGNFIEIAKEAGYKMAFTTCPGGNAFNCGTWKIKRFKIRKPDIDWLNLRLKIYSVPVLNFFYGMLYGWDIKLKSVFLNK